MQIGQGVTVEKLLHQGQPLAEGAYTVKAIMKLATKHKISMPICDMVYNVVYNNMSVNDAIDKLLSRELISENL